LHFWGVYTAGRLQKLLFFCGIYACEAVVLCCVCGSLHSRNLHLSSKQFWELKYILPDMAKLHCIQGWRRLQSSVPLLSISVIMGTCVRLMVIAGYWCISWDCQELERAESGIERKSK
jgi:hypothetical protein